MPAGFAARRIAGMAVAAAIAGALGARFVAATHDSVTRTRQSACRAMEPDPVPAALRDREAPDFELTDPTGRKVSLRSLRGRPVLVNFWATWCPPCVEETPSMEMLAHNLDGRDPVLLAVSVDDNWDAVRKFFGASGTKMSLLLDSKAEVPKLFGTEKYPETYFIDAAGHVRQYFVNKRDWSRPEAVACLESLR